MACRVHAHRRVVRRVQSGGRGGRSRPAAPTHSWTCTPPPSGSDQRRLQGQLLDDAGSRPRRRRARRARRTRCRAAATAPSTTWSASHGWVVAESRPVNRNPSPSASGTAAPSSGWSGRGPARPRPRHRRSGRPARARSARAGRRTWAGRPAGRRHRRTTRAQSTAPPRRVSSASAVVAVCASARSRRSAGTKSASPVDAVGASAPRARRPGPAQGTW